MNQHVFEVLKNREVKLCVLATASVDGKPESAVVGYAVKDDFTLLFSTKQSSRKCLNVANNPHVSFVTGWSFSEPNVQIDGVARIEEKSSPTYEETATFFFSQNPDAKKFAGDDTIFIILTPSWYRLLDHTAIPPRIEEKTL